LVALVDIDDNRLAGILKSLESNPAANASQMKKNDRWVYAPGTPDAGPPHHPLTHLAATNHGSPPPGIQHFP
jgi:hypothetical protein